MEPKTNLNELLGLN